MRYGTTAAFLVVALVGCGGGEFGAAPTGLGNGVEEAGPDTQLDDAAVDEGAEAATPEAGPDTQDAAPDTQDPPDAGEDVDEPDSSPDAAEEADAVVPDAEPDVQEPDAADDTEAGPDAQQDVEPDVVEPDAEPDAQPDAADEPEAFVCPAIGQCDGLQPRACLTDHWEDYGGICNPHGECTPGGAGKAYCEMQGVHYEDGGAIQRFDKPIIENLGLPDPNQYKSIAYALDMATDMRWSYNPVVLESNVYSHNFTTGKFTDNQLFCSQADVIAPAHGGWTVPTLAQFQTIMPQAYPVMNGNQVMVYWGVFIGTMPNINNPPYCHWTSDPGSAPGQHKAVWGPDGRTVDTPDTTTCAFWCTKPNQ